MRAEGAYELISRIGSGSSGEVHLARSINPPAGEEMLSLFAVKLIRAELSQRTGYRESLERERSSAIAFVHPNSCRIVDIGPARDGGTMIAMELLHGQTLGQVLQRAYATVSPLPLELIVWIVAQVSQALYAAHKTPWAEGEQIPILHGAISPQSVMITYDGAVKVLGMGLGRSDLSFQPSNTTLAYRAPELIERSGADRRADIYSLGVIFYDAITGQQVFKRRSAAETEEAVLAHVMPAVGDLLPEADDQLIAVVESMIRKKRGDRPTSLSQVISVLSSFLASDAEMSASLAGCMQTLFAEELRMSTNTIESARNPAGAANEESVEIDVSEPEPEELVPMVFGDEVSLDLGDDGPLELVGPDAVDHGPSAAQMPSSFVTSEGIELVEDSEGEGAMSIAPAFEFLGEAQNAMDSRAGIAEDLFDDVLRMSTGEYDIETSFEGLAEDDPLPTALPLPPPRAPSTPTHSESQGAPPEPAYLAPSLPRPASPAAVPVARAAAFVPPPVHVPPPIPAAVPPPLAPPPLAPPPLAPPNRAVLPRLPEQRVDLSLKAFPPPGAPLVQPDIGKIALALYAELSGDLNKPK